MLHGLRERYQAHHKVRITDESWWLPAGSDRYVKDRHQPDKPLILSTSPAAEDRHLLAHARAAQAKIELQRLNVRRKRPGRRAITKRRPSSRASGLLEEEFEQGKP